MTGYDAWCVALAEALELPLATPDEPLSKSNGVTCKFLTPLKVTSAARNVKRVMKGGTAVVDER